MTVTLSINKGIATLSLNRPQVRNALNTATINALSRHCQRIKKDNNIIAVLLKGAGKDFCAGADLHEMLSLGKQPITGNKKNALGFAKFLHEFKHLNKPTIALLHGSVFGGAIGLVACSDIVIAASNTVFCFSETKVGLVPAIISPYVIAAIGERQAQYYMLTAKAFKAKQAQTLGLIHEHVPLKQLQSTAHSLISQLTENEPHALRTVKTLLNEIKNQKTARHLQNYTAQLLATLRASKTAQEGLTAFLEKRSPHWKTT